MTCYIIKLMETKSLTCRLSSKNILKFPQHGTPFFIEVNLREIKICLCVKSEGYVTENASLITSSVHLAHRNITAALSPAEICS